MDLEHRFQCLVNICVLFCFSEMHCISKKVRVLHRISLRQAECRFFQPAFEGFLVLDAVVESEVGGAAGVVTDVMASSTAVFRFLIS